MFPVLRLAPGGRIIVWVSGQDRIDAKRTVSPAAAEGGEGWSLVGEDYWGAEHRVWQSSKPVEQKLPVGGVASLRFPVGGLGAGLSGLWVSLQAITTSSARVVCGVQGQSVSVKVPEGKAYRFFQIVNPDRADGAWMLDGATQSVSVALAEGAVRVSRLVAVPPGESFGAGLQDLHASFKVSKEGDSVGLYASGVRIDEVTVPALKPGESFRRAPRRGARFSVVSAGASFPDMAEPVAIVPPTGRYADRVDVEMRAESSSGNIRYTLDGSLPDAGSARYEKPIPVVSNTVIRARLFRDGQIPGVPVDRVYWMQPAERLPVLSVTMDQADLDDPETGLFMTRERRGNETERPCRLTLIEPDGRVTSAGAGIKVQGRSTRKNWVKKNWRFTMRGRYGAEAWPGRLFDEPGPGATTAFNAIANGHVGLQVVYDAAVAVGLRSPRTRMVALYINARPYGLYMLSDDITDESYLRQAFGHLDLSVYKQKTDTPVKWGATNAFYEAWGALLATPAERMTTNMVAELMDLRELTRFYCLVSYLAVADCGQGCFVRDNRSPDRRWSLMLWDQEGLFRQPYVRFVARIPEVVGTIFVPLSRSEAYMREWFYPEMQAMMNHAVVTERLTGIVSQHMANIEAYADVEWLGNGYQSDKRAAAMTREAFLGEYRVGLTNVAHCLTTRTGDMFGFIRDELKQTAIHDVVVRAGEGVPALRIDGYPRTGGYRGRYVNDTLVDIETADAGPVRFEVDGVVTTNSTLRCKVDRPLSIAVSTP